MEGAGRALSASAESWRQDKDRLHLASGLFPQATVAGITKSPLNIELITLSVLPFEQLLGRRPFAKHLQVQRVSQVSAPQLFPRVGDDQAGKRR